MYLYLIKQTTTTTTTAKEPSWPKSLSNQRNMTLVHQGKYIPRARKYVITRCKFLDRVHPFVIWTYTIKYAQLVILTFLCGYLSPTVLKRMLIMRTYQFCISLSR